MTLIDVTSADITRDRPFYENAFGWTLAQDYPHYPILTAGNGPEMGIAMLGNPEAGAVEPLYRIGKVVVFFGVADVKEALRKADRLGGKVLHAERAVPTGGSFGVFQDPAGNAIAVVHDDRNRPAYGTPATTVTAGREVDPAALVAISTPDVDGTRRYYEQLFGLRLKEQSPGYPILTAGIGPDIGIAREGNPEAGPAEPLYRVGKQVVLLHTCDIETRLRAVEQGGGKTFLPRTPLESGGAYAFFTDPSGNAIGLLERPAAQTPQECSAISGH
ncbi:VOC family protein [Nocardia sp. NPDC049149]|uniref:VOC family protein n=1 Tax=Nocardia sp. NPDC049149 TaxID=3364315 RepID=UPI00371C2502